MIDRGVLRRLHGLTQHDAFTLTVYVDLNQVVSGKRRRGYLVQGEALLRQLRARHGDGDGLAEAVERARELLDTVERSATTALIVVHPASGLAEAHALSIEVPSSAHWRRGAFLRPVVEALDEHERVAVVLVDQKRARLFTVFLGEIAEHRDLVSETGQRTHTTGSEQLFSQKRLQRHHEEEVSQHARRAVELLQELSLRTGFDRLVVAGPRETAAQVARMLPPRLRGRLVGTAQLPVGAPRREVLQRVLAIQEAAERRAEEGVVDGLIAELHPGGRAVAGLDPVVEAVNQGRVFKLVYSRTAAPEGGECRGCGRLVPEPMLRCALCEGELESVPRFVDRLTQSVLEAGGQVEVVDGPAAVRLHGGFGALLRY